MKLSLTKIIIIFIGVYLLLRFLPAIPISSVVTQKTDLFTVTGEGKVTVVPDMAIVNLGITTNGSTVKATQTQANEVITKVTQALKDLRIADKDIQTTNYSIYPQYDYTNGSNRITGYSVNASLTVTVRNIEDVNSAIDGSTAAGANTVSNIQFTVDEDRQKELLKEAREKAVSEAKEKASSLSSATGMSLGRIINIQETGNSSPRPIYFAAKMDSVGMGGGGETQVQPGSTDIISTIILTYETK